MVPAALRFSTPNPLSLPMMSRRTYLQGKQSHSGMGRTGGSTHSHDVSGRMLSQDVGAASRWGRRARLGVALCAPWDSWTHLDSPPSSTCSQCTEFMALILV